jgi:hypothetical protein
MATGLASGQANLILDALTGQGSAYGPSAGLFVKLHTGDPGAAGTSNAAGNTTRVASTFSAASAGSITNSADVNWTNVSTAETYSHVSFWTASSAGTFLGSDDLTTPRTVAIGDNFTIPASSLTIAFTPIAA